MFRFRVYLKSRYASISAVGALYMAVNFFLGMSSVSNVTGHDFISTTLLASCKPTFTYKTQTTLHFLDVVLIRTKQLFTSLNIFLSYKNLHNNLHFYKPSYLNLILTDQGTNSLHEIKSHHLIFLNS